MSECVCVFVCLDIAVGKFGSGGCKLALLQKDLKLAINMSDAVDQPLHVGSAVNEVPCRCCFALRSALNIRLCFGL